MYIKPYTRRKVIFAKFGNIMIAPLYYGIVMYAACQFIDTFMYLLSKLQSNTIKWIFTPLNSVFTSVDTIDE